MPIGRQLAACWAWQCCLGVCLLVDQRRYPHYQLQAWLPVRQRLTLVASLSRLAGAAGLLR